MKIFKKVFKGEFSTHQVFDETRIMALNAWGLPFIMIRRIPVPNGGYVADGGFEAIVSDRGGISPEQGKEDHVAKFIEDFMNDFGYNMGWETVEESSAEYAEYQQHINP